MNIIRRTFYFFVFILKLFYLIIMIIFNAIEIVLYYTNLFRICQICS